jgi:hypothetical protein
LLIGSLLLIAQFCVRDLDDRYNRPINGDAKGYFAYLPALFIYSDRTFSFVQEIEHQYYPEDGSQFKDFLNTQPNGTKVNKTFPGITIGYLPFFGAACVVAKITGFPIDGYAVPFQWSIVFAHWVYCILALILLLNVLMSMGVKRTFAQIVVTALLFATNVWYYVVYDQSVSHIFNLFLVSAFIYFFMRWQTKGKIGLLGSIGAILALLVISRPTNALVVLFLPLLVFLNNGDWRELILQLKGNLRKLIPFLVAASLICALPLLLWHWQTGYWFVYSYKDEGFNFLQPHFLDFLVSYQKGWLLWNPLIALAIAYILVISKTLTWRHKIAFILPMLFVVYVFSSWWCWTYGAGFGQRPMIEFLPFIFLLVGVSRISSAQTFIGFGFLIPFSFLSVFQGYQIANSIEIGGNTTKASYWNHFLQWKRDIPEVSLGKKAHCLLRKQWTGNAVLNQHNYYSPAVKLPIPSGSYKIVYRVKADGRHKDRTTRMVLSSTAGEYYSTFIGEDLYQGEARLLSYQKECTIKNKDTLMLYVWNGDTGITSTISMLSLEVWKVN